MIDVTPEVLRRLPLPRYQPDADKADRGKLLVIAGSARTPGAALLAARAALRVGCGTVRVAAPEAIATALGLAQPELLVVPLLEGPGVLEELEAQFAACDAAAIGPGLEADPALIRHVTAGAPVPLLVDAGALAALCPGGGPRVLTPHLGELAQLAGREVPEAERAEVALEQARRRGAVVVAKGDHTYIASPEGELYRSTAGSRALGTAGSGDVLAGAIAGLLAQGLSPVAAAVWGVHLHALAGEALAREIGEDGGLALEVCDRLPAVLRAARPR